MMKLFLSSDTVFTSNGEKILNALKCIETKTLNEDWFISVELPLTYVSLVVNDSILVVSTKYGDQPFRVMNPIVANTITFKARHIGYDLANYTINATLTDLTCQDAIAFVLSHSTPVANYTALSDILTHLTVPMVNMTVLDALVLLATEYGGYLDFNGFEVRITSTIGEDRQAVIAYAKNLESATYSSDWSSVCTKIKPIGKNGLLISGEWLSSDVQYDKPYTKVVTFDTEDVTELGALAQAYIDLNKFPKVNYKVSSDIDSSPKGSSNIVTMNGLNIITKLNGLALKTFDRKGTMIGDTIQVNARQFTVLTTVMSYTHNNLTDQLLTLEFGNYRPTVKNFYSSITASAVATAVRKASIMVDDIAGTIALKVDKDNIINQINLSTEGAKIIANNITLEGIVTANDYFKINLDGSVESIAGKMGGFDIAPTKLYAIGVGISIAQPNQYVIWAGETNGANGYLSTDAKFLVESNGKVHAGDLDAYGGSIGGWDIDNGSLSSGNMTLDSANGRIYVGSGAYLFNYGGTSVMGLNGSLQVQGSLIVSGSGEFIANGQASFAALVRMAFGGTLYNITRESSTGYLQAL